MTTMTMTTTRPGVSAQMRIMGWLLGFMALVLTVVVVVVWRLLVADVDDHINRGLEQETKEFVEFAKRGTDPATASPPPPATTCSTRTCTTTSTRSRTRCTSACWPWRTVG